MAKIIRMKKKKKLTQVKQGKVYIQASFNNTIVTVTDQLGAVLSWSSAGSLGFKGARKATPYVAQLVTQAAVEKAKPTGIESVEIYVSGVGMGREQAVRSVGTTGLNISSIKDITPLPHNGCRPKKVRRV